jgi:hypothetical protein
MDWCGLEKIEVENPDVERAWTSVLNCTPVFRCKVHHFFNQALHSPISMMMYKLGVSPH